MPLFGGGIRLRCDSDTDTLINAIAIFYYWDSRIYPRESQAVLYGLQSDYRLLWVSGSLDFPGRSLSRRSALIVSISETMETIHVSPPH